AASARQRVGRCRRPRRAAVSRPHVPVVAAKIDDAAVVYEDVADVVGRIAGRRIDVRPRGAGVGTDGETAARADEYAVGVRRIDGDAEGRRLGAALRGEAEVD